MVGEYIFHAFIFILVIGCIDAIIFLSLCWHDSAKSSMGKSCIKLFIIGECYIGLLFFGNIFTPHECFYKHVGSTKDKEVYVHYNFLHTDSIYTYSKKTERLKVTKVTNIENCVNNHVHCDLTYEDGHTESKIFDKNVDLYNLVVYKSYYPKVKYTIKSKRK